MEQAFRLVYEKNRKKEWGRGGDRDPTARMSRSHQNEKKIQESMVAKLVPPTLT